MLSEIQKVFKKNYNQMKINRQQIIYVIFSSWFVISLGLLVFYVRKSENLKEELNNLESILSDKENELSSCIDEKSELEDDLQDCKEKRIKEIESFQSRIEERDEKEREWWDQFMRTQRNNNDN